MNDILVLRARCDPILFDRIAAAAAAAGEKNLKLDNRSTSRLYLPVNYDLFPRIVRFLRCIEATPGAETVRRTLKVDEDYDGEPGPYRTLNALANELVRRGVVLKA